MNSFLKWQHFCYRQLDKGRLADYLHIFCGAFKSKLKITVDLKGQTRTNVLSTRQ